MTPFSRVHRLEVTVLSSLPPTGHPVRRGARWSSRAGVPAAHRNLGRAICRTVAPSPPSRPSASPAKLVVGLGFIPSVQFAPFYLADQDGYYRDAGPRGRVPEQDRPGPRDARRPGRHRRRHLATGPASSRPSARASRSATSRRSTGSSRRSSSPRRRRGSSTAARPARARSSGIPGPVRLVVDHAPGTPRSPRVSRRTTSTIVEYPDFGQGAAVAAGAGGRRDRVHQQRASPAGARAARRRACSRSTTSRRCPDRG